MTKPRTIEVKGVELLALYGQGPAVVMMSRDDAVRLVRQAFGLAQVTVSWAEPPGEGE